MGAEDIAKVLAEHRYPGQITAALTDAWIECTCGESVPVPVVDLRVTADDVAVAFEWHQAQALAPLVEQAKREGAAEALRDAAVESVDIAFGSNEDVRDWLRDRAERAAQTPRDGGGS
jgi:hypothetical protein